MNLNDLTASKIRQIRKELGYSAEKIAFEMGISKTAYSQMENGKTEISMSRLELLSKALNVPVQNLLSFGPSIVQINKDNSSHSYAFISNQVNNIDKDIILALKDSLKNLEKAIDLLQDRK